MRRPYISELEAMKNETSTREMNESTYKRKYQPSTCKPREYDWYDPVNLVFSCPAVNEEPNW
jgi:hypothetical protein